MQNYAIPAKTNRYLITHLLTFIIFLQISFVLGARHGAFLLYFVVVWLTSDMFKTNSKILNYAINATLIIGLSPAYLLLRGAFTNLETSKFDYAIYLSIWIFCYLAIQIFKVNDRNNIYDLNQKVKDLKVFMLSLTCYFILLAVTFYLSTKSTGDALAWIASGDSKNHMYFAGDLINYGFLNPSTFLSQPINGPTFLSLALARINSTNLENVQILQQQMMVYMNMWILHIGILGMALAGLAETLWKIIKKDAIFPLILLVFSTLIPLLALWIGPATFDGFFTAVFGMTTIAVIIAWFLEINQITRSAFGLISIGILIFLSSLMAWMFIAAFTSLVLLVGTRNNLRKSMNQKNIVDLILFALSTSVILLVHFSDLGQEFIFKAKSALSAQGAATVPNPNFIYATILILLVIAILIYQNIPNLAFSITLISGIQLVALFSLKKFSNLSLLSWNYYLLKYQWIMSVSVLAIIFLFALIFLYISVRNSYLLKLASIFLLFSSFYALNESLVASNQVWQKIFSGWANPHSHVINTVLKQDIDYKNPTLFFHFGYAGDNIIGNFWLNTYADPQEPIKGWNYSIDTDGDPKQLCELNAYYPSVTVITADLELEGQLNNLCPAESFEIKISSPTW